MLSPDEKKFLVSAAAAAKKAGHIWPEMAACEAALESGYGRSLLSLQDKNLFGMMQHKHPIYGTHVLPTREFSPQHGWEAVDADWVSYPNLDACFADRMATLLRLAGVYDHYSAALHATSGADYIREVSLSWSTDPKRAIKVQGIYDEMTGDWDASAS